MVNKNIIMASSTLDRIITISVTIASIIGHWQHHYDHDVDTDTLNEKKKKVKQKQKQRQILMKSTTKVARVFLEIVSKRN